MKICPSCNNPNRDEAKFCATCGENIISQQPQQPTYPQQPSYPQQPTYTGFDYPPQNNAGVGAAPPNVPGSQPMTDSMFSGTAQPQAAPRKKKPVVFVAVALVLVVVAAAAFFGVKLLAKMNDPVVKLLNGYSKLAEMKTMTTTTTLDFNLDYSGDDEEGQLISSIINDLTVKLETAVDSENLLLQFAIDLLYDKKSVIALGAGLNNEEAYVDLKNLYDKKFYVVMEDLVPEYPDYVNDIKLIVKAVHDVQLKIDNKKLVNIIKDSLDDNVKSSGGKVILTLDTEVLKDLITNLVEEIGEDRKLLESVRQYCVDIIKRIMKEEDNFKVLEVGELEDILEKFEDKEDFEDFYMNQFAPALTGVSSGRGYDFGNFGSFDIPAQELGSSMEELEIIFTFAGSGAIKTVEYSGVFNADEIEAEMKVTTEFKSGADFTKINRKNAVDIVELIDDYYLQAEVIEDVLDNFSDIILDNDKLADLIEELTGMDAEDALEYLGMMVQYSLPGYLW